MYTATICISCYFFTDFISIVLQLYTTIFFSLDETVEQSYALKCTHYDAFRFFQAAAQPLNAVNMPTRDFQEENEQSGNHLLLQLYTL